MDQQYVKTTRLSLFDGLELKEAVFQKHTFPEHFHDTFCIRLIEKGLEFQQVDNNQVSAHAGSVLILNPYEVHANRSYDQDSWKYRTIFLNPEVVKHIQASLPAELRATPWFSNQVIDDSFIFRKLLCFHTSELIHKQGMLADIVRYLIKHYREDKKPVMGFNHIAEDAKNFIQNNFSKKISLDALAGTYKMNKFHFIRVFKKHTGLTPISFLLLQRILLAKKLVTADVPMSDVGFDSGFYDQSHFNHYFKKYIGVSPLEYKAGFSIQ